MTQLLSALPLLGLGLAAFLADRWRAPPAAEARLVWALLLPLLAVGAAMPLVAWDDFSHWIPNARFLIAQDAFPHPSLPPPPSVHGTYPPGVALVTQAAGLLGTPFGLDRAPEGAAQVFTLALFGALAAGLAAALRGLALGAAAAAALAVAGLFWINPAFVPRVVFTNYGDAPTAALLGIALLLLLRATAPGATAAPAIQAALVMAAVVNVKQSGLVLAAVAFAAAGALLLADRRRVATRCGALAACALPALAAWWLWRAHAAGATGGFSVRPLAEWAWHLAPHTLASMGRVAWSKVALVGVLALAAVGAAVALRRRPETPLQRAAVPVAVAAPGWAGALFLSYLGTSFSEIEIRAAASFWRYMQQVGGGAAAVVLVLAMGQVLGERGWGARIAARLPAALRRPALLAVLVALLPAPGFAHLWPRPDEPAPPLRRIAAELAPVVAGAHPVAVVDPAGVGLAHVVLAFAWHGQARTQQLPPENLSRALEPEALRRALEASGARHVFLASTDEGVVSALGTPPLPRRHWRLLERDGQGWRTLREGPVR